MSPRWTRLALFVALSGVSPVSTEARAIQIVMDKIAYIPTATTTKVGDTIEWVNKDIRHTGTATNGIGM
jgi:plastocyanin